MKRATLALLLVLVLVFVGSAIAGWITSGNNMHADVSGNVGIGTANPQQKLHVSGIARFDLGAGQISMSTPGSWPGLIAFSPNGHRRDVIFWDKGIRIETSPSASAPPGGNGIAIAENGNVGIRTNPAYPLDVAGLANLNKGKGGIALRVNNSEALWYNGTYFSWGYGGKGNYFAHNVGIGVIPSAGSKLYVKGKVTIQGDLDVSGKLSAKGLKSAGKKIEELYLDGKADAAPSILSLWKNQQKIQKKLNEIIKGMSTN